MDELRRILDRGNSHFLHELKTRCGAFFEKAQFYGVFKKVVRPPLLDKVKHSIAMMKALPVMLPSPVAPPKKLGHVRLCFTFWSLQKTPTPFIRRDHSSALSSLYAKLPAYWPLVPCRY